MSSIPAREIFKRHERVFGAKRPITAHCKVVKVGKISPKTAYRIVERTKWINLNPRYEVDVARVQSDGKIHVETTVFWQEEENALIQKVISHINALKDAYQHEREGGRINARTT